MRDLPWLGLAGKSKREYQVNVHVMGLYRSVVGGNEVILTGMLSSSSSESSALPGPPMKMRSALNVSGVLIGACIKERNHWDSTTGRRAIVRIVHAGVNVLGGGVRNLRRSTFEEGTR